MAHLDSITLHNFKSFRHASIKFSKGFNCIVGANGSGKSNICDSLLFALGESSLRRMRAPNASQLINSFAKPKKEDGIKRAYVKVNFTADQPIEVARYIKSSNKMGYRLNGKAATRQEVVEALRSCRSDINDTNIIAQNEISYMVNLNPKQRRELIDVAAGIKEFNDKKDSAMKELEKVQARINETQIALNERKGFLEQLGKEKDDAERYAELSDTVKRITYTLLKNSETQAESEFNSIARSLKALEEKRKGISSTIAEIDLNVEKLTREKDALAKSMSERSSEMSSTNRQFEDMNREFAVKDAQMKSMKDRISEIDAEMDSLRSEQEKLKAESSEAKAKCSSSEASLADKEKELKSKEHLEGIAASGSAQMAKVGQNQKKIEELYVKSDGISKRYMQFKFELESINSSIKSNALRLESGNAEHSSLMESSRELSKRLSESESRLSSAEKEIKDMQAESERLQKRVDGVYAESTAIREQLIASGAGSSDRIASLLKREVGRGFHGRAYELCTYDDKYAYAVNAAASGRLGYLVVDSAETADQAIKLIKSKQLGRASFIPLKDMSSRSKEENPKFDRLIDHVRFDGKFSSAFSYIFAGTYIVRDIAEAKSLGFGKGRFVTLEGELVEQSGVITGGSMRLNSPAILEAKLRSLEDEKSGALSSIREMAAAIEGKRKEYSRAQSEAMQVKSEIKYTEEKIASIKSGIDSAVRERKELDSRIQRETEAYNQSEAERNRILSELNALKVENEAIYSAGDQSAAHKSKIDKSELEKLKSLRSEAERLRISIATLSKEQELKGARLAELEQQLKSKASESRELKKKMAIIDNEMMQLRKTMKETGEMMGKSDAASQKLYREMQALEESRSRLSNDKGKLQADMERANREIIESETRRVQLQTRISDIKAELVGQGEMELVKGQPQELEAKRAIARNDIERLGAVNMRAPEVYESKKKEVEEANSRLDVLSNEKESIVSMIGEIESRKLNIFTQTLADVNANFQRLYGYIFDGTASLELEDQKDPFGSGLSVSIKSPKNRNSTVEALSGGEKSLVIMMLIFAIQAHDPMSLYIFDEIDAALDKENSKKLSRLMKEMSKKSQLIVISHNDSLITAADAAIGVVHRGGESRVVGLELSPVKEAVEAKQ